MNLCEHKITMISVYKCRLLIHLSLTLTLLLVYEFGLIFLTPSKQCSEMPGPCLEVPILWSQNMVLPVASSAGSLQRD